MELKGCIIVLGFDPQKARLGDGFSRCKAVQSRDGVPNALDEGRGVGRHLMQLKSSEPMRFVAVRRTPRAHGCAPRLRSSQRPR
jgi:hypothetical protein